METTNVRVRFAPSPTGPLHIGGVRTALYNFLFARHHGGKMILRIEDTDQGRYVPGAENYIMEALAWAGIEFDEGIREGGDYGPYRQSERKDLYKSFADDLIAKGHAYYAFDTPEELQALRQKLEKEKASNTSYNASVRMQMKNSLSLSAEEVDQLINNGAPYVIRYKMPENESLNFNDIVRGDISVDTSTLDDKVLFKSDGMPTYHLANIVDDHLMKITHVIRGEEWLPSLALHIMLYRSFGWDAPAFAHLPLLLKPDGKGKLSKRDGDRLGFPVFPLEWQDPKSGDVSSGYRESGYLAEAFVNFLALLGWNPGTEEEIFDMDGFIKAFSLERVGKSGSRFDHEKAKWFNHQYLIKKTNHELALLFSPVLEAKGIMAEPDMIASVCGLVKERVHFVEEIWDQADFFFKAPESYDPKVAKKRWKENTPALMESLYDILNDVNPFTAVNAEEKVKAWITEKELGMGAVMNAFRLCIVGTAKGPNMFDIIAILGKEESLERLKKGIESLS